MAEQRWVGIKVQISGKKRQLGKLEKMATLFILKQGANNQSMDTMMATTTMDKELDVKGLNCPLPILRAKKALADMTSGQTLRVVATDPGSVKDFAAFCKQTGNTLLSSEDSGKEFTFVISKR
jgi:tRNA 2-thiouridine synthesizing protein A